MLKFTRNKLVSIVRKGPDSFVIRGILDDDIYSLKLDLEVSISDLEILSIKGDWHRWTSPECPRSIPFLQGAVGFRVEDEDFSEKVQKILSRKACRHFANIFLECCHCAKEAADLVRWEDEKAANPDLGLEDFLQGREVPPPNGPAAEKAQARGPMAVKHRAAKRPVAKAPVEGPTIDLHTHTYPASQCSSAPVDELIEEAKRIGLDGICLTDHNHVWKPEEIGRLRKEHGFMVLGGNEITTDQGDMVVFGLDEDIQGIIKLEELRDKVEEAGAFMIAAHPFRGFLTFGVGQLGLTVEKAMERPLLRLVDAVEVLNGKVTEKENSFAADVAAGVGLPVTGGSDAHEVIEVGTYATRFPGVIKNEEDLINALKKGDYSPVTFRKEQGK
jgi:predicted metal-dependent phosphoesterase TrpH